MEEIHSSEELISNSNEGTNPLNTDDGSNDCESETLNVDSCR